MLFQEYIKDKTQIYGVDNLYSISVPQHVVRLRISNMTSVLGLADRILAAAVLACCSSSDLNSHLLIGLKY